MFDTEAYQQVFGLTTPWTRPGTPSSAPSLAGWPASRPLPWDRHRTPRPLPPRRTSRSSAGRPLPKCH
jgi:hypothetical protein